MGYVPSSDQVAAQIRLIVPAVAAILMTYGFTKASGEVSLVLLVTGPSAILICAIWSLVANTREAIMRKASKAVAPGEPVPQILLPKSETALADKLPDNVTAAK
jgi:hypothetical protein